MNGKMAEKYCHFNKISLLFLNFSIEVYISNFKVLQGKNITSIVKMQQNHQMFHLDPVMPPFRRSFYATNRLELEVPETAFAGSTTALESWRKLSRIWLWSRIALLLNLLIGTGMN